MTYALPDGRVRAGLTLLARGLRAHPRTSIVAIGSSAVYGIASVASGWLLGRITDEIIVPGVSGDGEVGTREIWLAALALTAVALVTALSVALRRIYAGILSYDVQADHRRVVTRRYLELPLSWHRRRPTGELLSHASSDAEAAAGVFAPLPLAIGVVVMLTTAAGAMLAANLWLGLLGLAMLPLVALSNAVYERRMSPAVALAQARRAEVADVASSSLEAAQVVKTLGTADLETARFAAATDASREANTRVGRISAVFDPVLALIPTAVTLAVIVVGTVQVSAGAARTGSVVTSAFLLSIMAGPVASIGFVLGMLPRAVVGHERVARVVDAEDGSLDRSRRAAGSGPAHAAGESGAVVLRGVTLDVPGPGGPVRLLEDVALDLAPGVTLAVVGSTGSGKSTLLDVVAGLTPATAGDVVVAGLDVAATEHADLARRVAYVTQEAFVFSGSVRENVTLTDPDRPGPSDEEVWDALERARLAEVVRALPGGLDAELGERGTSLSGGQRQRLTIARALVRRPRVLLLDDATSALDPAVEGEILASLDADEHPPTVVMAAYRPATIAHADLVAHIESGRLLALGTVEELLASDPGFADLLQAYERDRS